MKFNLLILFAAFSFSALAQKEKSLFNGKDLDGWTIHGTEKWYVDKGELICESGPDKEYGYLSTNKNYKNFILTVHFKQDANGNRLPTASGVDVGTYPNSRFFTLGLNVTF